MNMNRNELTILLSAILLACFFLPVVEWDSFEMSGFNFVLSTHTPDTKYFLLVGPFSALFLLLGSIYKKNYAYKQNLARSLPFLGAIMLFVICYRENPDGFSFRNMDIGFWIAFIASFLLVSIKPQTRFDKDSAGYSS
jgi:hypothetical protein